MRCPTDRLPRQTGKRSTNRCDHTNRASADCRRRWVLSTSTCEQLGRTSTIAALRSASCLDRMADAHHGAVEFLTFTLSQHRAVGPRRNSGALPELIVMKAAGGGREVLAGSVSTRRPHEANFRHHSPVGQSQLAASPRKTRSRPIRVNLKRRFP
jgi:hypothetical protein